MSENDLNFIREEMRNNLSIRTTLLTFSFTAVITTIGFGISNFDSVPFWVYIIPVIITIVFSARIAYYKDRMAKMNAYLYVYCPESVDLDVKFNNIENGYCARNKLESFLITYELLILSALCCPLYCARLYVLKNSMEELKFFLLFLVPVFLLTVQFYILRKFPAYYKKTKYYIEHLNGLGGR